MNLIERFLQFNATHHKRITQVAAAMVVGQGLLCAKVLLDNDKLVFQSAYMIDIIKRNQSLLDDFDIYALKELGVIKDS